MAESVKFLSPSYFLYFGFLTMSLCIFDWHFGCDAASCQDFFSGKPKPCFPQPINAARKRNITASNTCGSPKSSYCQIGPGTTCFVCDANSSASMHPARFMVDRESPFSVTPTWWQSETWWDTNQRGISKMGEPLRVNISLDFGKSYHISGKIKVTFYSERPQAMIIERSKDSGITWMPYQYFAKDCLATYGMAPSESAPADDLLKVICSEDYSGQFPTKNGIVEFQAYTRYSPEDYLQPEIQDYMKATHVRLRLEYPGTDGLELIDSDVTLNRYYYAISDIRADGRCDCHGHAEFCDGVGMNQYCYCEHNTTGRDCEYCKPLYNNQAWKAANKTHANQCQKCHCNDHATACRYNSSLATGACIACIHNTTGTHCDQCNDGFYRNLDKVLSDLDVCLPCECFPVGIIDNGTCSKESSPETPLGQCNCKPNVFGRRCDECVPGYWGFRLPPGGRCQDCGCNVLGALNSSKDCDQQTGSCFCKSNIEGEKCSECRDGYHSFPSTPESGCLKCPCDLGGASKICEKRTGLCRCRNNVEGRYCVEPKSGYFYPNLDYLLFEAELQDNNLGRQLEKKSDQDLFTGQGFARLTPGSAIRFENIRVNVTWQYYIVVRYAVPSLSPNHNLTLSVNSLKTRNEIAIPLSDLRVGLGIAWTTNEAISLDAAELYNISLASTGGGEVDGVDLLIDSLVLKPEVTRTRVYRESKPETVNTLLECLENASALVTKKDYGSQCSRVVFSYSAEMYDGALACDCNQKGTSQVDRCDPNGGQCSCNEGVDGRTCSYCQAGYYGFGHGNCKVCHCDSPGVQSNICDLTSGVCQCKSSASGERCERCKTGTFNLDSQNLQGCQHCFGYDHGQECKSARGFIASNISSNFIDSDLDGWRLVNNSSNITNLGSNGLILNGNDGNVTLAASSKYLGVQLKSYKQRIIVKVASTSTANLSTDDLHILLEGNGYQALLRASFKTFPEFYELSFVVDERRVIGDVALTEFQFQSMLSNLSSLELSVRSRLVLNEVVLETAVYDSTSDVSTHIGFVENMTCFENYTGLSCESCASGFTRAIPDSGPFSHCVPCACSSRTKECDPESGICIGCDLGSAGDHCEKCQFNVIGQHCNVCADGFYGLTEDDSNCKPCDCHLPGTQHGNTSSCNVTTGQCKCNKTLHTGGRRCNVCQENAWNRTDSTLNCEECPSCYGAVKVEVDKFRQNFSTLLAVLRLLKELPILSFSPSFGERVRTITKDVEELTKSSQELASKEKNVKHELQRAFDILNIFDGSRKVMSTNVNATLDVIVRITSEHQDIMRITEDIRNLVTDSYYLLNNTINGLVNKLQTSMELLHDWSTTLSEIRTQSEDKAKNIVRTNDSVHSGLNTARQLTIQAIRDARRVVSIFESLVAKIPNLQVNSSSIESIGENALSNARQRYHNASVVFNLTSQLEITTPNISEKMSWLDQHAEEVSKNASDIIKAVQKLVQSSLDIAHQIQQPLELLPTLQEQVRLFESRAAEYHSRSRRQQDDANTAVAEAEQLYVDAQTVLATVRDYPSVVRKAKARSEKSVQDVNELSYFYRSKILFANNVSKSVESSHNLLDTMTLQSETVGEHARDEHEVISKTLVLSKQLKNETAIERGITAKNNNISAYVRTMVEPVREKCLSITRDTREAINNSTNTMAAAVELLAKVTSVSEKLDLMIRNFNALPTINVKPLAGMKSDIARIRENLKALKLTSSLEKLRQGKVVQEKWLAEYKPRVTKLRESVAFAQKLIASLRNLNCDE